ncbi:MAG TPA: nucleotidyltransferase domain-containing protein [Candidatus Deferrimicrobium sp.]|nr:nucleotidyltransferase domain-containing protein [Candidatus Deferrimicrobium sp.]
MNRTNLDALNIPERANNYLRGVIKVLEKFLGDRLLSIIMFGSLVKGYVSEVSDADILVIVSDDCTNKELKYLHRSIMAYEIKFHYLIPPKGLVSRILSSIDKSTGMFISHFIGRKKDFLKGNFAKTFQVNKLMAMFLAPNDIVYGSVLCRAKVLYGQDLIQEAKIPNVPMTQLLKSILMNMVTSLLTLFIYPLTNRATLYEMESAKWSFLAAYYYVNHDSPPLPKLLQFFLDRDISTKYVNNWIALRKNYRPDQKFGLLTPWNILKIHAAVLKQRK